MKKLSLLLALMMVLSMAFASVSFAEGMPAMNTTDEIVLTYMIWDEDQLTQYLADEFHKLYPNITINVMNCGGTDYVASTLTNMAAEGSLPDMFQWLDLDPLLANPWMADITQYVENDPEYSENYLNGLQKVGYVDGKRCYFFAAEYLPAVVYLDAAVFDKLNVEMPGQDWTFEDMLNLMETMTDASQGIWAYNSFMGIITVGPISLTQNAIGEFGWDGESYHFESGWVEMVEKEAEYQRLGYRALGGTDAYLAVVPDNMWPGESGHVAMQHDAWWTWNNIYTQAAAKERGVQMVPYHIPTGEGVESGEFAWLDFCSISSTCQYPREAYEALKFLTWGKEGFSARCDAYATLVNEAGDPSYKIPGAMLLTNDEEVIAKYRNLFPADEAFWDGYFANTKYPVTFGGRAIPGFNTFITDYYHNSDYAGYTGIEAAINSGTIDPYDYTDALNAAGRAAYDAAMAVFYQIYGTAE